MLRFILCISFIFHLSLSYSQPKHEIRAVWLTTAYGLDWPKTQSTSPASMRKQQAEVTDILDKLKAANINTVLLQTRIRGNLIYRSSYESISSVFTGQLNGNPGYDPLKFVIDECHKRGMECHAWIVAFPLGTDKHIKTLGQHSPTRKHPDLCISYRNEWYMNPGHPDTKSYLMSLVTEIIRGYDVDGIHFDYFRYPEHTRNFPDNREYKRYGKGKNLDEWRRDNLTGILRHIYKGIKEIKPWVKVSSSPVGKFQNTARYSSKSWNAYSSVYQDVNTWLVEGIQDQLYPMMYFKGNNFYPFALDWEERSNGRHIIPGLGIYLLDPKEGNWSSEEVERQLHFIRTTDLEGTAYYRSGFLVNNVKGLYDKLRDEFYIYPALIPPTPWLDNQKPTKPGKLQAREINGYTYLNWEPSTDNDPLNQPKYILYGSDTYPVDIARPDNIIAPYIREDNYTYAPIYPWQSKRYYALTAIDRYGNESEPVQAICY